MNLKKSINLFSVNLFTIFINGIEFNVNSKVFSSNLNKDFYFCKIYAQFLKNYNLFSFNMIMYKF
jgi:IS30 family transposase